MKNKLQWNLIADTPPTKGKFIAIYTDSSGSRFLYFDENGFLHDGDDYDEYPISYLDNFLYWIPLPDNFTFWGDE